MQISRQIEDATRQSLKSVDVEIDSWTLRITNPAKIVWPARAGETEITKGDLLRYLTVVAPAALPHLNGRPLTAVSFPGGLTGPRIYQKNWKKAPEFVSRVEAPADKPGGLLESLTVQNLATLMWLSQMNVVEFHPWVGRAEPVSASDDPFNYPDILVFDLDPFVPIDDGPMTAKPPLNRPGFAKATGVALALRELLQTIDLKPYVKTSGKTGIHVYVPIERRYPFELTRALAEAIGRRLMEEQPDDVTLEHAIPNRRGKILVDYGQNGKGKNQVAPYSPRATEEATVSMPVSWENLANAYPLDFTVPGILAKGTDIEDPWRDFFTHPAKLDRALSEFGPQANS